MIDILVFRIVRIAAGLADGGNHFARVADRNHVVVLSGLVGAALQLNHWVLDVSPFTHLPKVPGAGVSAVPLLWLAAVVAALAAAGLVGLRRRDIPVA